MKRWYGQALRSHWLPFSSGCDGAYDLRTGTGFPESDVRGDFSDGNRRVDSRPDTVSVQGESCRADDPDVYRTDRTGDDGTCICRKGGENDTFPFSPGRKNYDWIRGKI